ncbi:hypothetical protein EYZ11_007896 [Aspergillus tanneri]|uniref:Uncharacterized protein n=1 Tax=Aspergillus tanneri TaxID=1220188 RepID=A0A4V3UNV0_9EURO|nr:hypothetical protein EYZ11_007896 [Aspergillus tanneri]
MAEIVLEFRRSFNYQLRITPYMITK